MIKISSYKSGWTYMAPLMTRKERIVLADLPNIKGADLAVECGVLNKHPLGLDGEELPSFMERLPSTKGGRRRNFRPVYHSKVDGSITFSLQTDDDIWYLPPECPITKSPTGSLWCSFLSSTKDNQPFTACATVVYYDTSHDIRGHAQVSICGIYSPHSSVGSVYKYGSGNTFPIQIPWNVTEDDVYQYIQTTFNNEVRKYRTQQITDGLFLRMKYGYVGWNGEEEFNPLIGPYPSNDYKKVVAKGAVTPERAKAIADWITSTYCITSGWLVDTKTDWHGLAAEAVGNVESINFNGIAFIKDALTFGRTCKSFVKSLRNLSKDIAKNSANLFLSSHYGFKLTYLDTVKLLETMKSEQSTAPYLVASSMRRWEPEPGIVQEEWYQIHYDRYSKFKESFADFTRFFDLDLDADNIWDMIPYSFVVDWFLHIGDALEIVSKYDDLQSYRIHFCSKTKKQSRNITTPSLPHACETNLKQVVYARQYEEHLTAPLVELKTPTPLPMKHIWEGGALLLQRL